MSEKQQYVCPICGSQIERFVYHQHVWFTRVSKSGKLTKQSRKLNNGPIGCSGFNCTNPKCNFYNTDQEIINMIKDGKSELIYLQSIMS